MLFLKSMYKVSYLLEQVIKNNLNPTWKRFCVPLQHFCGGDPSTPMEVRSLPPEWIE